MEHVYNCMGHEIKIPNIVDSYGPYVIDEHGTRYLDLESGVWCTALGHKNERIVQAATEQLNRLMHAGYCYSNNVVEEAATLVLGATDLKAGKCVFLCSGSEAIEISRQISRHLTGKPLSMTLNDSYLGAYSSVTDRSRGWHIFNWEGCKSCKDRESCNLECPLLRDIPSEVSDFVFEPGSSSGFVRFPPKAVIKNITQRVKDNGGKVIANEVTTGTGRTGKWFGYQHYDIVPDMVAIGKGIGNGYPVSIAVIDRTIVEELDRKPFKYGQSHMNDPLGAAIVREVVRIITEENLIAESNRKGELFLSQLRSLVDAETIPEVRGRGLMMAVDVPYPERASAIYEQLLRRGFIVSNRKTAFRIDPPLIISEKEFGGFIDSFRDILGALKAAT
jgi:acetylornithine/N-succinyldiaminopimelate aminotransferase